MYRGTNNNTEIAACLSATHLDVLSHGIEALDKFMFNTLTRCRHVGSQVGVCLQMYSKQILYVMHSTYLQFLPRNLSILSISRSMAENNVKQTAYLYIIKLFKFHFQITQKTFKNKLFSILFQNKKSRHVYFMMCCNCMHYAKLGLLLPQALQHSAIKHIYMCIAHLYICAMISCIQLLSINRNNGDVQGIYGMICITLPTRCFSSFHTKFSLDKF